VNGSGLYIFGDGDRYDGQWRKDRMWGKGVYTTAEGKVFDGYWKANRFMDDEVPTLRERRDSSIDEMESILP